MLRTPFALCATGATCGLLGACLSTGAVAAVTALEAPETGLPRQEVVEGAHAYVDFGFGGRFLEDEAIFGNVDQQGVVSGNLTFLGSGGLGFEGGAAFSFPGLSDTLDYTDERHTREDATVSDLWLGACWRLTEPSAPLQARVGAGPAWVRADVSRNVTGSETFYEEDAGRATGFYLHGSLTFELPLLGAPMSVGVDLRYVGGTEVEFFGDETPRVDGSLDYVQFLLVFSWSF